MKTYLELTPEQRARAVEKVAARLLRSILEGGTCFDDARNGNDLQARIDKAIQKAEDMRTPWFAHEYILDTCRDDIQGMAQAGAEEALYPENTEDCIMGVAEWGRGRQPEIEARAREAFWGGNEPLYEAIRAKRGYIMDGVKYPANDLSLQETIDTLREMESVQGR